MKKIVSLILGSSLILAASVGFAAEKTDLSANWTCTTNASSASTESEKAADDKMAKSLTSAAEAYAFAALNCRNCTKITCEAKN